MCEHDETPLPKMSIAQIRELRNIFSHYQGAELGVTFDYECNVHVRSAHSEYMITQKGVVYRRMGRGEV